MSILIQRELSMLFTSDPAAGAENVSADGTSFGVSLSTPLAIPASAMNCSMAVIGATVWNTSPNISAAFGNNIFRYTTSVAPAGTYTEVLEDGLYSLDALNAYLAVLIQNRGLPGDLFILTGDNATQRTVITVLTAGDSIAIGIAGSVGPVMGWPTGSPAVVAPVAGFSAFSPQSAAFNRVNSYVVLSNVVSTGIQLNGTQRGILAQVPITALPGSQIVYLPTSPQFFPADELIGNARQSLRFQLTDQVLRPAPTAGDFWTVTLLLRWAVLLTSQEVPLRSV